MKVDSKNRQTFVDEGIVVPHEPVLVNLCLGKVILFFIVFPLLAFGICAEDETNYKEELDEEKEEDLSAHVLAKVLAQDDDQVGLS